ncbi:MAG: hypothetical protein WC374_01105 [Phycisphaerae bacterium]|jgi:hypothetical protein
MGSLAQTIQKDNRTIAESAEFLSSPESALALPEGVAQQGKNVYRMGEDNRYSAPSAEFLAGTHSSLAFDGGISVGERGKAEIFSYSEYTPELANTFNNVLAYAADMVHTAWGQTGQALDNIFGMAQQAQDTAESKELGPLADSQKYLIYAVLALFALFIFFKR